MRNEEENVQINRSFQLTLEEQAQWRDKRDEWVMKSEEWFHGVNSGTDVLIVHTSE